MGTIAKHTPSGSLDLMPAIDRVIDAVVFAQCTIDEGMRGIIGAAAAIKPSSIWEKLRRVRWGAYEQAIISHFTAWLHGYSLKPNIKSFWFCAPAIYMNPPVLEWCGMASFVRDDHEAGFGRTVFPAGADMDSRILQRICPLPPLLNAAQCLGVDTTYKSYKPNQAGPGGRYDMAAYAVSLGYSSLVVSTIFRKVPASLWLGKSRIRGVFVGFYEGGHHQLGFVDRKGWTPRPVSWSGFDS